MREVPLRRRSRAEPRLAARCFLHGERVSGEDTRRARGCARPLGANCGPTRGEGVALFLTVTHRARSE